MSGKTGFIGLGVMGGAESVVMGAPHTNINDFRAALIAAP